MPKLQLNDDGTITFPLKGRPPVTLDEPSLEQLGEYTELARKIDDETVSLPQITTDATAEQLVDFQDKLAERTGVIFGAGHPYGDAVLKMVNDLAIDGESVGADQLYGWAASPATLRAVLQHFRVPLLGEESPATTTGP